MPNVRVISALLFIVMMSGSASAGEALTTCKEDPRVIEPCRWVKGVVFLGAQLEYYIDIKDDDVSYILDVDRLLPFDDVDTLQAGEFEFCKLRDATLSVLADAAMRMSLMSPKVNLLFRSRYRQPKF